MYFFAIKIEIVENIAKGIGIIQANKGTKNIGTTGFWYIEYGIQ